MRNLIEIAAIQHEDDKAAGKQGQTNSFSEADKKALAK
jgi:hypothetical protein